MMKKTNIIILISLLLSFSVNATEKKRSIIGIQYFNQMFGHLHKNPSRYSTSLTTITCGHPVKVYRPNLKGDNAFFAKNWHEVKAGPYQGFLSKSNLSSKQPDCFQDRYPKFFDQLGLDLSEMYYWGKLYDQYLIGKSKVR